MTEENIIELNPNVVTLYRELGQIEARVKALEGTAVEIKALLTNINAQLLTIQTGVATALGRKEGSKETSGNLRDIITIAIAAVTALIIAHYGK